MKLLSRLYCFLPFFFCFSFVFVFFLKIYISIDRGRGVAVESSGVNGPNTFGQDCRFFKSIFVFARNFEIQLEKRPLMNICPIK